MINESKINFLYNNCTLNILTYIKNSNSAVQFKELRFLSNPKTNKKYSSSTISEKLKKLQEENLIEKIVIKNKSPTRNGYILTEKSKKTFEILKETEDKYSKL